MLYKSLCKSIDITSRPTVLLLKFFINKVALYCIVENPPGSVLPDLNGRLLQEFSVAAPAADGAGLGGTEARHLRAFDRFLG